MSEFLTLFLIGIGLSMDTFSVSLSIGALKISDNLIRTTSLTVGLMHFIMPLLGLIAGIKILSYLKINPHYILAIILIILALKLVRDLSVKEEAHINLSYFGILAFAFAVSIDSLTTGLGLSAITKTPLLAMIIFSICSFSFTYLGLIIGKYTSQKIGKYATLLGIFILFAVAISHLCQ